MGKTFTECNRDFAECLRHSAKQRELVVDNISLVGA